MPKPRFEWTGNYVGSRPEAILIERLLYKRPGFDAIDIPAGFTTDFASVPRCLSWFISPTDKGFAHAGIIHDWCYREGPYSQATADVMFRELLIKWGAPTYKAWLAYFALRMFGRKNFTTKNYEG